MQCQALTKKGTQCSHRATYPEDSPITCKIWAHMQQIPQIRAKEQEKEKGPHIPKKTIKIVQAKKTIPIPTKTIKTSSRTFLDKNTLDKLFAKEEIELDAFLDRKGEITAVLNALYEKGLALNKGDNEAAIEYLKGRFTKQLAAINWKILSDSLPMLESYQKKLIVLLTKYDVDEEYAVLKTDFLRHQLDRTLTLINVLKNLHSGPKGGQAITQYLKEYDMNELEAESMLSKSIIIGDPTKVGATNKAKEAYASKI